MNDPKPEHPLALGAAPFGRQCLIARRLVKRGVRFIQIYHGGGHQQHIRDLHATILHFMGLDYRKLTYFYGGLDQKLTGVVEPEIIQVSSPSYCGWLRSTFSAVSTTPVFLHPEIQ